VLYISFLLNLDAQAGFSKNDVVSAMQAHSEGTGGNIDRLSVSHDPGAVAAAVVKKTILIKVLHKVDVSVASGYRVLGEDHVIRPNQLIAAVANLNTPSDVDSSGGRNVTGLFSRALNDRQFKTPIGRGQAGEALELDVELGGHPGRRGAVDVRRVDAQIPEFAAGQLQAIDNPFLKRPSISQHGVETGVSLSRVRSDGYRDLIEGENISSSTGGLNPLLHRLHDGMQNLQGLALPLRDDPLCCIMDFSRDPLFKTPQFSNDVHRAPMGVMATRLSSCTRALNAQRAMKTPHARNT
jgi:hypothetical protein